MLWIVAWPRAGHSTSSNKRCMSRANNSSSSQPYKRLRGKYALTSVQVPLHALQCSGGRPNSRIWSLVIRLACLSYLFICRTKFNNAPPVSLNSSEAQCPHQHHLCHCLIGSHLTLPLIFMVLHMYSWPETSRTCRDRPDIAALCNMICCTGIHLLYEFSSRSSPGQLQVVSGVLLIQSLMCL